MVPVKKSGLTTKAKVALAVAAVVIVGGGVAVAVVLVMAQKTGGSLRIPKLKPPVVEATPTLLKSSQASGRRLNVLCDPTPGANNGPDCKTPIQVIENRLFSSGPTDFTGRLAKVDDRMQELVRRDGDTARTCVAKTSQAWTPTLPDRPVPRPFEMQFSCEEQMNGGSDGLRVFFGSAQDWTYIAEIQKATDPSHFNGAVLAKINTNGNDVHVFQIGSSSSGTVSSIFEIVARPDDEVLQVAFATNEVGTTGIGCGVSVNRLGNRMYVVGKFADSACETATTTEVCLDADTHTDLGLGNCSSITGGALLGSDALTPLNASVSAAYASTAFQLVDTYGGISALGLTDFNDS